LGASEKGLFMRLEGLFLVNLPQADGQGTFKECRASGSVYELVDSDWEESSTSTGSANGKGKERATAEGTGDSATASAAGEQASAISQGTPQDVSGASEGLSGPSFMPGPSPLKPPPLPNPDPAVPVSDTVPATISQTTPAAKGKKRTLNGQLSHPVLTTPYPLPPPPKGFKFRAILPPGHEVVVSLTLISGRYYPGLLTHPLMKPAVDKALAPAHENVNSLWENRHLWAMDGLMPGLHQTMDPIYWKQSRHHMLKEADDEARKQLRQAWEELKGGGNMQAYPSASQGSANQLAMDMDGDVEMQ